MVYDIVFYPDAPLREIAQPVQTFDEALIALAQDMLETMHAYEGVGLAAPQIGLSRRVIVLCEPEGEPMCLVNPEILEQEGSQHGEEGCLSMPRVYGSVPRATCIQVKGLDETGAPREFEARDFLARIIQHEVDHLNGIMFPDRLDIITRDTLYEEWKRIRAEIEDEARRIRANAE